MPPPERIAMFDNDGTLWSEQPIYFQVAFALDRVKALGARAPRVEAEAAVQGRARGRHARRSPRAANAAAEIMAATHAGNTTDEFAAIVNDWIGTARHPSSTGPTPSWSISRCWSCSLTCARTASRPTSSPAAAWSSCGRGPSASMAFRPEQVVGSRAKVKYEVRNGDAGAPAAAGDRSHRRQGGQAGRHSPGDRPPPDRRVRQLRRRLRDARVDDVGAGPRLGLIVHHTDAEREWAYDRTSHIGRLARALDEAPKRGWIVVDMKQDWKVIYPFQK